MRDSFGLIVITEGGAHTIEYLHRNGVYPGAVVLNAYQFKEMLPYLSSTDEVLLIINGLTDFKLSEVYALLRDLEEASDRLSKITIVSNTNLGVVSVDYYLYSGDLFYGVMTPVIGGVLSKSDEKTGVDAKSKSKSKRNKNKSKESNTDENTGISHVTNLMNTVMGRYKKYGSNSSKFSIYGSERRSREIDSNQDSYLDKVVSVDLFNGGV